MNKDVEDRIKYYEDRRSDIISGKVKPIPFFGMPRLTKYIPGIIPGIIYHVISGSGTGKTNFTKFVFIYQTILYAMKNNVNFQVIYFALEESKEEFIDGLIIHILKRKFNIIIDRFILSGMSVTALDQKTLDAIKTVRKDVSLMMSYVKIIDDCYTPTLMYNKCRTIATKLGKFSIDNITKNEIYTPNDPNQLVLVVTDHISLIEEEYEKETDTVLTHHKSISKWHTKYLRKIITKQWKWTGLTVQQLALEAEKQQYTQKGESVLSKIMPSLEGVADNKIIIRDSYVVLGLFAPERFGIEEFKGYDITRFGDNFRSVQVLKSRFGTPNKILPLYFRGDYNYFEELPDPTNKTKLQIFYDKMEK